MRIIKVGGTAQTDPALAGAVAAAWNAKPGSLCVVHGGGNEISHLQRRLGLEPKMEGGRRVTTADDLAVVRMVLSGLANKRLVSALARGGVNAVGISGEDGSLLTATVRDLESLGLVGNTPVVKPDVLITLLRQLFLPVISPVAACAEQSLSESLNVNGDDAAAAIAVAVGAEELLFISDVPGVRGNNDSVLREISAGDARALISNGTAAGGMAAKLDAALSALDGGVGVVRIGNIAVLGNGDEGTLISSPAGVGK